MSPAYPLRRVVSVGRYELGDIMFAGTSILASLSIELQDVLELSHETLG